MFKHNVIYQPRSKVYRIVKITGGVQQITGNAYRTEFGAWSNIIYKELGIPYWEAKKIAKEYLLCRKETN